MANSNDPSIQIIDNNYFSDGFPRISFSKLVKRDNYIAQIEDFFKQDVDILFIDGEEETGKTTLCGLYASKNANTCISVFFNPLNMLDYTISYYCQNVIAQIKNILHSEFENSIVEENEIENYNKYIFELRKFLKSGNKHIPLIIDGLENIIKTDRDIVEKIMKIIPFGQNIFKLLITGSKSDFLLLNTRLSKQNIRSIYLTGFSEPEMTSYLEIDNLTSTQISDLYKITKGFPGRLRLLKKLILEENYSVDDISSTTTYTNWIERDCTQVDLSIPFNSVLFSLLSISTKLFSSEELSNIFSLPLSELETKIYEFNIIENKNGKIYFTSAIYKSYFYSRLKQNKNKVHDLLLKYYSSNSTISSKLELVKLHHEHKEWNKVIEIFDDNYIQALFEASGSIKIVSNNLDMAYNASSKLSKYSSMWKYSLEAGILNELDHYLFGENEINARIAIKDFRGAILLAESAILNVDRLNLLSLIARKEKEYNNKVDEDLAILLRELYENSDLSLFGDKIFDIVANLIYAIPNLAIEIIEKSSGHSNDQNINDWIIAKLTIAAIKSTSKEADKNEESKKLEAIQHLKNPSVDKIQKAISFLVGNYSAFRVLDEVRKLPDTNERVKLLRLWLRNHKNNTKDVEKVIDFAIQEIISFSSIAPIAIESLLEISLPIPFLKDYKTKIKLKNQLKSIARESTSDKNLKTEYLYRLSMFHIEYTLNKSKALSSLDTILTDIKTLPDLSVKFDLYSEIYVKILILSKNDSDNILLKNRFNIQKTILEISLELFKETANHLKVSAHSIRNLGKFDPALCLKIIKNINTQDRREKAYLIVAEAYLDNSIKYINSSHLIEIESELIYSNSRFELYKSILERFSEAKSLPTHVVNDLFHFTNKCRLFPVPEDQIVLLTYSYLIFSKNSNFTSRYLFDIQSKIYNCWQSIESDWVKIDLGFNICSQLANVDGNFTNKLFNDTINLKSNSWLDSNIVAVSYLINVKLIIKCYINLLIIDANEPKDFNIIEDLLSRIPSIKDKLLLWSELCIQAHLDKKNEISSPVLNSHILPLLQNFIENKLDANSIKPVFISLHLFNSDLCYEYLNRLETNIQENIYFNLCHFYTTHQNPFEIYEPKVSKYLCTYNDLMHAVALLDKLFVDSNIYFHISNIADAIKYLKKQITDVQAQSIHEKINLIITSKLPDINNIQHNGYIIISNLKNNLINKRVTHNTFWTNLHLESNQIPNTSDRIFVKSILIEEIPFEKITNGIDLKKKIFLEIINDLSSLQVKYEYLKRVADMTDKLYNIDKTKWKEIIINSLEFTKNLDNTMDIYESQKTIIDVVYKLDPTFAVQIYKSLYTDGSDDRIGNLIKDYLDSLEMAKKIRENESIESLEENQNDLIVDSITRVIQGINSGRVGSKKINEITKFLSLGIKMPLYNAFPIYSYYLINCNKTYTNVHIDKSLQDIHRENFKATVTSTNIIEVLSQRKKTGTNYTRKYFMDEDFVTNEIFHPGTREEAVNYLKNWIVDYAEEYVIIADPYFKKEDIEIVKYIKDFNPNIDINILASVGWNNPKISEEFSNYWNKLYDERPPFTNITFCWVPENNDNTPFHDRFIISLNCGLRLGTSINSLGLSKESEVSIMKNNEALKIKETMLFELVNKKKKELNSLRIMYLSFTM